MGTNYYLHLGKRSGLGGGKGCVFSWAVSVLEPTDQPVIGIPPGVIVVDEYGREMTAEEFTALIADDESDFDAEGRAFS